MLGVYFSGTGNTRYCVEKFVSNIDKSAICVSIEDDKILSLIDNEQEIIFGYPVYFSNIPILVRDFINSNREVFNNKKIFIIATMGLFSGDGAGCSARLFKKCSSTILGGLHLKMPDCIGDSPLLKKSVVKNKDIVEDSIKKINTASQKFKHGRFAKNGLSFFAHIAGLFGQRLWFYNKTKSYKQKPNINKSNCIACSKCVLLCPTKNLVLKGNSLEQKNKCTMCYRCVSFCPTKSLTILGKKVIEQSYIEKYIDKTN